MQIAPTGEALGAVVTGIDLAQPLEGDEFATILTALGRHGLLRFPGQTLGARELKTFSERFGPIQGSVTGKFHDPEVPEVGILSNIQENGQPIGLADAGQDWHTDMSYNRVIGFVNVLHAVKVPRRDGKALGSTVFANMHAAYDALDPALKSRLEGMTATHDFNKFWEEMRRRPGSTRGPLTPEQRAKRPPSVHPIFLTHPITGRKVLYCNPGYAVWIEGMEQAESDATLEYLFKHQSQPQYLYSHRWTPGDVLMWDNIGTTHNAVSDYRPEEPRLIHRVQVMATLDYGRLAA